MSFHPLPNELEWIDCTRSRVEAYSSRWKLEHDQCISTCLYNEMNARECYAYYRCDIYNDIVHNRKICPNRQRMYNNFFGHVMIYYNIFLSILNLYNFTSIICIIT